MKIIENSILKGFCEGAKVKVVREDTAKCYGAIGVVTSIGDCGYHGSCPDHWDTLAGCPGYMSVYFSNERKSSKNCWGYHNTFSLEVIE